VADKVTVVNSWSALKDPAETLARKRRERVDRKSMMMWMMKGVKDDENKVSVCEMSRSRLLLLYRTVSVTLGSKSNVTRGPVQRNQFASERILLTYFKVLTPTRNRTVEKLIR
jgi:hypothetical protein